LATQLNCIRHLDVFEPSTFDKRIDVIGCGAVGSRVMMALAKLGIDKLRAFDMDKVESHNIPNQIYGLQDVGEYKVEALQQIVERTTGARIEAHNIEVDGQGDPLGPIVFLLTDTMSSRKEIFNKALRNKLNVELVCEGRMGTDICRSYCFDPRDPAEVKGWEDTLCDDEEVIEEGSACGTTISVGPTAEILSGMAVWQMMRWVKEGKTSDHELILTTRPFFTLTRDFKTAPV